MNPSSNEPPGFLAELAGEARQKLEAKRAQQQDREQVRQAVHAALLRCFQFFDPFVKHLNTIEPDIPRVYVLDGRTRFANLKWKNGMTEYRKQSLADNALLDHVYFQMKLVTHDTIQVVRRWEQFEDLRRDLNAFGLRSKEDLIDLWRNRSGKTVAQVNLEPEFVVWIRFRGNYPEGRIEIECNNLNGFGFMYGRIAPDAIQPQMLDDLGRFLIGRLAALPSALQLGHDSRRNL